MTDLMESLPTASHRMSVEAPPADAPATVALIGDGFSAVAVGLHLLRSLPTGATLRVQGHAARMGRGLAYGTECEAHLLNVPAGRLGWLAADEGQFAWWLSAQGLPWLPSDFVPRRLMGDYLQAQWQAGVAAATARSVRVVMDAAPLVGLQRAARGWTLGLPEGRSCQADQVVLATGHLGPAALSTPAAVDNTPPADAQAPVLIVGAGLTAVDHILALRAQGHQGEIHVLSRRGQMPQPHRVLEARPCVGLAPAALLGADQTLRSLTRQVRAWVAEATRQGQDWRDVMASLRPDTPALWQRLSLRDRRQFLRHLQPWWDTHRHRMAPEVWQRLQAERAAGRLHLWAGRLHSLTPSSQAGHPDNISGAPSTRVASWTATWTAVWQARGTTGAEGLHTLQVAAVRNCTGPSTDLQRTPDPLWTGLRARGLVSADALGLGLLVDARYRPLDACGVPNEGLYYVGPWLKAQYWEAIAIPELRVHAQRAADAVTAAVQDQWLNAASASSLSASSSGSGWARASSAATTSRVSGGANARMNS
jgi:uncharacterized NAD(P)/FAD-binding protein YdhS